MGFLMTFAVLAALGLIGILVSLSLRVSRALRLADMANQRLSETKNELNCKWNAWLSATLDEIRSRDTLAGDLQSRVSRLETVRRNCEKEKLDYKCMLRELSETSERCKQLTGSLYNVKETVGELSKVVGKLQESETVSADLLAGIKADADEMLKTAVEYSDQDMDVSRNLAACQKQLAEHHRFIVKVSEDVHGLKKLVGSVSVPDQIENGIQSATKDIEAIKKRMAVHNRHIQKEQEAGGKGQKPIVTTQWVGSVGATLEKHGTTISNLVEHVQQLQADVSCLGQDDDNQISDIRTVEKKLAKLSGQQKQVQSLVNQSLQGVVVGGMDSKPGARKRGAKPSAGKTSAK